MEKNSSCIGFKSVDMHNGPGIPWRLLCVSWWMGLNCFNLLLQCNGIMLFSLLRYQGTFIMWKISGPSLEASLYDLFGLIVMIWSLTMWDGMVVGSKKTIWDALFDYGHVAWRWCIKKISQSLTFEQKILENFDKGWGKESCHLCEGR